VLCRPGRDDERRTRARPARPSRNSDRVRRRAAPLPAGARRPPGTENADHNGRATPRQARSGRTARPGSPACGAAVGGRETNAE